MPLWPALHACLAPVSHCLFACAAPCQASPTGGMDHSSWGVSGLGHAPCCKSASGIPAALVPHTSLSNLRSCCLPPRPPHLRPQLWHRRRQCRGTDQADWICHLQMRRGGRGRQGRAARQKGAAAQVCFGLLEVLECSVVALAMQLPPSQGVGAGVLGLASGGPAPRPPILTLSHTPLQRQPGSAGGDPDQASLAEAPPGQAVRGGPVCCGKCTVSYLQARQGRGWCSAHLLRPSW